MPWHTDEPMIDIKQRGEWRGRVTNVHGPMGWHGPAYRIAASRRLLRAADEGIPCYEGGHVFDGLLAVEQFREKVDILGRQIRAG